MYFSKWKYAGPNNYMSNTYFVYVASFGSIRRNGKWYDNDIF